MQVMQSTGSIWIGEKLRAHAQFSEFFVYGYLLDIKIAANSPYFFGIVLASFWHRLGIVASFLASFVASFGHRFGIVIRYSQPPRASTTRRPPATTKATSHNRSPSSSNKKPGGLLESQSTTINTSSTKQQTTLSPPYAPSTNT